MTLAKLLWLLIGWFSFLVSQEQKNTQNGEARKALQVRTRAEVYTEQEPPVPEVEAPPTSSEMEKRVEEAEKLGEVGRSLVAQMVVEARPSMSGGEELAWRKLRQTVGGKAPWKEFLRASKVKKPQRYWLGMVVPSEICQFQKSTDLLICKLPFSCLVHEVALAVGLYDMHFQVHAILTLQEAAEAYLVGFLEDANLWHHSCEIHHHYAQRYTAHLTYVWRTSSLLNNLLPNVCFGLSVGCMLCQILLVWGRELNVGFALYILLSSTMGLFLLVVCKNVFLPSQVELEWGFHFFILWIFISLYSIMKHFIVQPSWAVAILFICIKMSYCSTDLLNYMSFVTIKPIIKVLLFNFLAHI